MATAASAWSAELAGVAVEEAVGGSVPGDLCEEADEEDAGEAGDPVRGEHVERLVHPGTRPQDDHRVARQGRQRPQGHRPPGTDVAAGRGDADAADDDRRRRADRGDSPPSQEVENEPDDQGAGRCQQRVGEGEDARVPGGEAAAAVEAEPPEPEQAGAEEHVDGVVGEQRLAAVVLARRRPRARRRGRRIPSPSRPGRRRRSRASRARPASRRRSPSGRGPSRRAPTRARRRPGRARTASAPPPRRRPGRR